MSETLTQLKELKQSIERAFVQLKIPDLVSEEQVLQTKSEEPDFWQDTTAAQITMKQLADVQTRTTPWTQLLASVRDLEELAQLNDDKLADDITTQLTNVQAQYNELKEQLKFNQPYDDHSAIVAIYAGAGGTDAQDWAGMLERMYLRWCEKQNVKTTVVDRSAGEEAGLKSVVIQIDGPFVYGKLKSEHGVHRLVRLSPFNSDNLRQTSFAKVDVLPKIDAPDEVEIDEKDLKIDVYRSGGHGGQSVNTTDSAVRVTHIPSGISVAIQNERSQIQNRETAMTILRSRLAQLQQEQHKEKLGELKGPNQSAEWGNQIRSYVLHPYKQVKDVRTKFESSDPDKVLDGDIDAFINAYLEHTL